MEKIFQTRNSTALFVLRVMLGIAMFPHGAQKMFGWFGGYGYTATMTSFVDKMHIPFFFAFVAIMAEFLGSMGLIVGLLTRVAAFGLLCEMIVVIWMVHWANGFFMNWWGQKAGEGFEYHLLVIGMCLALLISGGGKWSVDRAIASSSEE
jgi:putative oxidoreductase